jgi:predicted transcriptional regulator
VKRFLDRGGVLVWGIVPTTQAVFEAEGLEALEARLLSVWEAFFQRGVDRERLIKQSLLSPATCCLINADREKTVEKAFETVRALSARLRERFGL